MLAPINSTHEKEVKNSFESYSNGRSLNMENKEQKENDLLGTITLKRADEIKKMQDSANTLSMRNQIVNYLLRLLFGDQSTPFKQSNGEISIQEAGGSSSYYESYMESETTCFQTVGKVQTADGREISFDLNLEMSRRFMEFSSIESSYGAEYLFKDPLVINTGSGVTNLGTQSFFFDIDCDGKKDEISTLGEGSGFLALDKNGDGTINDGSELFGAMSGDGFKDLFAYDLDENGWIDEADDIYSKLKIWYADGSSEPKLITLKEAGVGAICLSNSPTNFSLNDAENKTNAFIRKSGIFLYENGGVGTIQHLDMVQK